MFQNLPSQVHTALNRLQQAGYEAYIVGGCVRDLLMGQTPNDYDITTSALPEQTALVFDGERKIDTGLKHGTLTVILDGEALEITSFRVDGSYTDGRHPDAVRFTSSLAEDLSRRDFTINAMAYAPSAGLVDLFGGQADLLQPVIRCVGTPELRFREDALRILRALRFSSVLDFPIDPDTDRAIRSCAPLLEKISPERIAVELKKLLCGKGVRRILMNYAEVLGIVIPELLPLRGFDQKNIHHCYDLLEHSAAAVEHIAPDPVLRMAALLHDIGKPLCFSLDSDGVGHFYGHAIHSAEIAEQVLTRLRSSRADRERIVALVHSHDVQIPATEKSIRRALGKYGPDLFFQLLELKRADNLAQAPAWRDRQAVYDQLEALAREILTQKQCFSLRDLAVKGSDLGIPPGPAVGSALKILLEAVMEERIPNERQALLEYFHQQCKN